MQQTPLRTVVVVVGAVGTYLLFTRLVATSVLHFPKVSGNYGGDALAFIDWVILIVLWHAVALGGYFGTRRGTTIGPVERTGTPHDTTV